MAETEIRERPTTRTSARADLAAALAERRVLDERLAELRAADPFAAARDATQTRDRAAAALAAANDADVEAAAAAILAGRPRPPASAPAARQALEAAEQDLAVAQSARAVIAAELAGLEQRVSTTGAWAVRRAVAAIAREETAPAMQALLLELDAIAPKWIDAMQALQRLLSACAMTGAEERAHPAGRRPLGGSPYQWAGDGAAKPKDAAVAAWLAALGENPDAPLPL
jgi:hypothetical protein